MTARMSQAIEPQFRSVDGLSIRFAESEDREDHAMGRSAVARTPSQDRWSRGGQSPVLVFAGKRDVVVPPANAEYVQARLPKSKLEIMDSGHWAWEDAADDFAAMITGWWSGGYQRV